MASDPDNATPPFSAGRPAAQNAVPEPGEVDSRPPMSGTRDVSHAFVSSTPPATGPDEPDTAPGVRPPWRTWFDVAFPGGSAGSPREWVEAGYWRIALAFVIFASPALATWGSRVDLAAASVFVVITALAWLIARRSFDVGVGLHLAAVFPYWSWYACLPGGVPTSLHVGVGGHLLLLVFPVVTMVALWGRYGAVAAAALGIGSTVVVWPHWSERFMGVYAVAVAILMGAVFRRLAVQLAATHRALSAMAYRDPLTGAANRRLFYKRARKTLAAPSAPQCGVLSIGLNRFKAINDSLGHTVGDELLRHVAARVQQVLPRGATFARLGGDEFAVFLPDVPDKDSAHRLAKLIVARLRDLFHVRNHSIHVGARVGVAVSTGRSHDLDQLIRAAEAAMNRAKERGKSVDELSWQGSERVSERLVVEVELRSALSRSELDVYFQPVVRTADGTLVGAEALVRWNHVRRGPIAPSEIIAIAEESGLIAELDRYVCGVALGHLHGWLRAGWDGWVAVNLAAPSFSNPELPRDIKQLLLDANVAPERLVVEITESRAMRDPEASASTVHQLKALGVGVAIDDFGIGYSSLAYLKMFPVDHIKIDRYFVQGIGLDDRDEHLIEVVTDLARKRGIAVLAEGIETDEQLAWLRSRGCAFVQGFLVGRPVPASEFDRRWLRGESDRGRGHVGD